MKQSTYLDQNPLIRHVRRYKKASILFGAKSTLPFGYLNERPFPGIDEFTIASSPNLNTAEQIKDSLTGIQTASKDTERSVLTPSASIKDGSSWQRLAQIYALHQQLDDLGREDNRNPMTMPASEPNPISLKEADRYKPNPVSESGGAEDDSGPVTPTDSLPATKGNIHQSLLGEIDTRLQPRPLSDADWPVEKKVSFEPATDPPETQLERISAQHPSHSDDDGKSAVTIQDELNTITPEKLSKAAVEFIPPLRIRPLTLITEGEQTKPDMPVQQDGAEIAEPNLVDKYPIAPQRKYIETEIGLLPADLLTLIGDGVYFEGDDLMTGLVMIENEVETELTDREKQADAQKEKGQEIRSSDIRQEIDLLSREFKKNVTEKDTGQFLIEDKCPHFNHQDELSEIENSINLSNDAISNQSRLAKTPSDLVKTKNNKDKGFSSEKIRSKLEKNSSIFTPHQQQKIALKKQESNWSSNKTPKHHPVLFSNIDIVAQQIYEQLKLNLFDQILLDIL